MNKVTRQRTAAQVPSGRASLLDQPPRDFSSLPGRSARTPVSDTMRRRPSIVEQTIVLAAVPAPTPPPSSPAFVRGVAAVNPTDVRTWRRGAVRVLTVLLPPRWRTYRGGVSDLPAPSLWDIKHDTDDWADQEVPQGRHVRRSAADVPALWRPAPSLIGAEHSPEGDTPCHLHAVVMALTHLPSPDDDWFRAELVEERRDNSLREFHRRTSEWLQSGTATAPRHTVGYALDTSIFATVAQPMFGDAPIVNRVSA